MHNYVIPSYISSRLFSFFFFNDTATTEIYTLSLHDALPIYEHDPVRLRPVQRLADDGVLVDELLRLVLRDRKSTRLNSSHLVISYAVFCLKKKIKNTHAIGCAHLSS